MDCQRLDVVVGVMKDIKDLCGLNGMWILKTEGS